MNRIGLGRTAEVFEIDNNKILKLFFDFIPYELVKQEYEINVLLSQKIKNMPTVFELINHDKRYGIVYQKINGSHMGKFMGQELKCIPKVIRGFSNLHKAINEVIIDNTEIKINNTNDIISKVKDINNINNEEKKI